MDPGAGTAGQSSVYRPGEPGCLLSCLPTAVSADSASGGGSDSERTGLQSEAASDSSDGQLRGEDVHKLLGADPQHFSRISMRRGRITAAINTGVPEPILFIHSGHGAAIAGR